MSLTAAQHQAIAARGNGLVTAGADAGKTSTLAPDLTSVRSVP